MDAEPGRVGLRVEDAESVVEFYESVVGLDVLTAGDPAVLGAGGEELLVVREVPELPERGPDETGLYHVAFRVPTRRALGDALARLGDHLDGAADHGVSEALYCRDPADNGVEVYCDRPREEWPMEGERVAMVGRPLDRAGLRDAAAGEDGAPPETDVGHVHLSVSDVAASRAFYERVGLRVRQDAPSVAFLAAGDYHHHVAVNEWEGRTEPTRGRGLDWFELRVGDGLAAARERAGGESVRDPDGIALRLVPA